MLKNTCCRICLSNSKRTVNIFNDTDLRYVYEKLANYKIADVECWLCYICHTRLRQCLRLQQMAMKTRGLIDDIFQDKIEFGTYGCLLELLHSKTKVISMPPNTLPNIKQEPDGEEYYYNDFERVDVQEDAYEEKVFIEIEGPSAIVSKGADQPVIKMKMKELSQSIIEKCLNKKSTLPPITYPKDRICGNKSTEIKQELEGDDNTEQDANTEGQEDSETVITHPYFLKKEYKCHICSKLLTCPSKLRRHIRAHTGEKPWSCDFCPKKFAEASQLRYHTSHHTGEKPYACDVCSKRFPIKSHLKHHKLIHTDEKPYLCDVCPKRFLHKVHLQYHMLTHTGVKAFSCDICQKKFAQKKRLNTHKLVHTGVKPFTCDICSQSFTFKSNLKQHIERHEVHINTPYTCDICSKSFTSKASHSDHMLIHKGEKNHACHICGKKFTLKRYLVIHVRGHEGVRKFSCDVCSKRFTQKGSLNAHKRLHCQ
ncbi:zinc finger protein 664-like [Aricia agestis]|uniref:zinc finger protein 664-like n=1 Tax=Aricia agestis TaxID=91739 RepID=UPI001C20A642|nr:zinc finger protein 664-like [Aricia agestis]